MKSFDELSLNPLLLRAINDLGYEHPSPIQVETLPILLNAATDFIGQAATGTGKTAAFAIPMLQKIDPRKRKVQALILSPTRELAMQISEQIGLLGKYLNLRALPIYGGSGYVDQMSGLKHGAQIVVGTPGRLVDHLRRGTLRLDQLETLVLDEADEMISMGFKEDLEAILAETPKPGCNVWLFSATMDAEVKKVANDYLTNPKHIQVNKTKMLSSTVEQYFYLTPESNKRDVLCRLIDTAEEFYGLVFCQTKALVSDLSQYLISQGYKADCLHGDMDQNARERTMKSFRERRATILVCTDVASRGLDVKDISHVVNYSLPRELENYVHRIGRTARSGKTGIAMSLVTQSHKGLIGRIEHLTKTKMKAGKLPTAKEMAARKVAKALEVFEEQSAIYPRAIEVMDNTWKDAIRDLCPEEIAGRFLAMLYPEVFSPAASDRRQHTRDIERPTEKRTGARPIRTPHARPAPVRPARVRPASPVVMDNILAVGHKTMTTESSSHPQNAREKRRARRALQRQQQEQQGPQQQEQVEQNQLLH